LAPEQLAHLTFQVLPLVPLVLLALQLGLMAHLVEMVAFRQPLVPEFWLTLELAEPVLPFELVEFVQVAQVVQPVVQMV